MLSLQAAGSHVLLNSSLLLLLLVDTHVVCFAAAFARDLHNEQQLGPSFSRVAEIPVHLFHGDAVASQPAVGPLQSPRLLAFILSLTAAAAAALQCLKFTSVLKSLKY